MRSFILVACFVALSFAGNCGKGKAGCPSGQCCSVWGWCGSTKDHCGSGSSQCACDCNGSKPCVGTASSSTSCTSYTTTADLNVRSGPSTYYSRVKTLGKGTKICVISISNGWAKISSNQYVSASYIKQSGSSTPAPSTPSCTTMYTTAELNVRTGPSTSYSRVKTLSYGSKVCVVSTSNGWSKLNDGYYVSASYLTKNSGGSTGSDGSTGTGKVVALNIAQRSSPNKSSRNGWVPDVIVCHITEGGYAGAVSWLCNPQAQASCHFVVSKKGEITQLVPIDQASWCQGISTSDIPYATSSIVKSRNVNPNRYCVGIEHEGFYSDCKGCLTEAQKNASGSLIRHIKSEIKRIYNKDIVIDREHVIGHYQVYPRGKPNCPGQNFPFNDVIAIANKK